MIPKPESVCPERVRRKPERRRRKFRPETLRHRNGRRRKVQPPRGFWRAVDSIVSTHRRGAALKGRDRKSTRLNSSHLVISYAVFCLKKKKQYRWYYE